MVATYRLNTKPLQKRDGIQQEIGNCKNLLLLNPHIIKIISYMILKNLKLKNFIPFEFSKKILNPHHKNTFNITSVVCNWCAAIFTVFFELLQLIQN